MAEEQEGPAAAAAAAALIRLTAKAPGAAAQLVLREACTVRQLRARLARRFGCEPCRLVLVFFGRILQDQDSLRQCGVRDGTTVHLLIRPPKREAVRPPSPPAFAPAPSPGGPPPSGGSPPPAAGGPGSWAAPETSPCGAGWQLVPPSETVVQKVRQVLLANPEIQQLAQRVPAVGHILNNADIVWVILDKMREIMGWVRSPSLPQEPKSPEQPSGGLWSSAPGGDSPSRPPSSESQEPGLGRGPDSSAAPSPCGPLAWGSWPEHAGLWGPGLHAEGQEGCLPLSLSSTSLCPGGSRPDEGGPFSGLARPLEHGAPLPAPGVAGIPAPGSAEIPLRIVSLCNAYTKHMMLSLMWGSLLAVGGGQAAPREHVQQQLLRFSQQMRSPEMVAAMANPKAIQAWVQMEQGLQTLLAEAPVLVPWFMLRLRGLGCSAGAVPWPQDPPGPGPAGSE
ncbi:ubiquilin-1-like [Varanus komodoensis]|uniref:ubiquilin-1-like n=1 Tax=Varanus komodoensis TaxID=61221 RepID=UPI001CF78C17|nr:ubiquilin-1-like [Varanus komodoensis]